MRPPGSKATLGAAASRPVPVLPGARDARPRGENRKHSSNARPAMPARLLRGRGGSHRFKPGRGAKASWQQGIALVSPVVSEVPMVASESDILAKAEEWAKEERGVAL